MSFFFLMIRRPPRSPPLPTTTLSRSLWVDRDDPPLGKFELGSVTREEGFPTRAELVARYEDKSGRSMTDIRWYQTLALWKDRKSTRLNSSHANISYAVFCLKKKKKNK